jgi:ABC-2 type transport system ATP-binding protein
MGSDAMTMPWIEIENLNKRYGQFQALSDLSLNIAQGEVFGFLGPNGAGKTTTLRILMGTLVPDRGSARIRGLDCIKDRAEVKRQVGYVPDVPVFYDYLKGWELLRFVGQMHGLDDALLAERAQLLLRELSLADAADDFVTNYSLGMKKKMGLALALIHDPEVLILDEPTTGLDPLAMRQVQNLIQNYAESGRTVLLSTHLLEMAERQCQRIAIVHRGRLVAEGRPAELLEQRPMAGTTLEEVFLALTAPGDARAAQ